MGKEDYQRYLGEISNLQKTIQERKNKREPFLSSFADALVSIVQKIREWFDSECELASREISILEQLNPDEEFDEEKENLKEFGKEFTEIASQFEETIKSIKERKIESLKDLGESTFAGFEPSFLTDIKAIYDICVKLEELIISLEKSAKYISRILRTVEIVTKGQE